MKSLIILTFIAIVIASVAADASPEIIKQCATEFNVKAEDVKLLKDGDLTNNSDDIKCLTKCILEKDGYIDSNADLIVDYSIKELTTKYKGDSARATTVINKCKDTEGVNHCDKAFNIYSCYIKAQKV